MAVVTLQGVWLHDPLDPDVTAHQFVYNGDGATEEFSVQSTRTQYAGRAYAVVDYGEDEERSVTVNVDMETDSGDVEALRAFVARRALLCYRDAKSRIIYGQLTTSGLRDDWWGQSVTLRVDADDFTPRPYLPEPDPEEQAASAADLAALAAADAALDALVAEGVDA